MSAHVEILEEPGACHFQVRLDHVTLPEIQWVGDHVCREEHFVAFCYLVRGVAQGNPCQDGARFSLVAGDDREEFLFSRLHHPAQGPVDRPPVPEDTGVRRERNHLHLLCSDRVLLHRAAQEDRFSPDLVRTFRNGLDPGDMGRERRNDKGAFIILVTGDGISYEIPGDPLARAPAGPVDIGALHDKREHAFLSNLAEPGKIRGFPDHRRPVELEIAGIDDRTVRGVENRCHSIDDRVLGPYEFKHKMLRDRVPLPGLEREELVVDPELLLARDLLPYQFRRVGRGDDRRVVPVRKLWDRPDVVEMPVGADNRFYGPLDRVHHGVVRYRPDLDQIQGVHILKLRILVDHNLVKAEPHVKNDNLFSAADSGHIPPDLVVTAHCNNFYIHVFSPVFVVAQVVFFKNLLFSVFCIFPVCQGLSCFTRGFPSSIICRVFPVIESRALRISRTRAAPHRNIEATSSRWTVSTVLTRTSSLSSAGFRKGSAMPQRSAPRARHFAISIPFLIPPDAITGLPVPATSARLTTVGMPQPAKSSPRVLRHLSCAFLLSSARMLSTAAQDVPPQPPVSIAAAPALQHWRATSREIPHPVSLTITGVFISAQRAAIAARQPVAEWSPSGWIASWRKLRWMAIALAPIIPIASSAQAVPWSRSCTAPRFATRNAWGASSRTTENVSASAGFSRAALWEPTPMPRPKRSAIRARRAFVSFVLGWPPVIADIKRGDESLWPKNRVDRSIERMSHSGSALWTSLTSPKPVSPDSTSFSAQIRRWSSLRNDVNCFLSAISLTLPSLLSRHGPSRQGSRQDARPRICLIRCLPSQA